MVRIRQLGMIVVIIGLYMGDPTQSILCGDEGMWLFNNPPKKHLKEKYNFDATKEWLEHVQKSSVRFNSGGSGSFVSPDGLVMTNHHVGADDLQKLSNEKKNYLRDGFHAKTLAEEIPCKALELNVLLSIKNVTDQVNQAVPKNLSGKDAFAARQKIISEIESSVADEKNSIRADVVTLYAGGEYHLYTFKKYTDIRLVFAPEQQIAFYGGDPDNFEYPRFDLDMCFFRVYENGKPAKIEHYLKWSANGSKEDELAFVSGHPGRTNRQNTIAELEYLRDIGYPYLLQRLNRYEVLLGSWSERSEENRRRARELMFGVQNSRKARVGGLAGLLDPTIMARKIKEETQLLEFIKNNDKPEIKELGSAFDVVKKAEKRRAELIKDYTMLEAGSAFFSAHFNYARALLRASEELPKPNGERLREFSNARLPSLKQQLFSDEPIYDDFETLKLADGLSLFATQRGANDPMIQKILNGKSPRDRAFELISKSKMKDPEFRKKLFEGGKKAVDEANDPMIELARLVDADSRKLRQEMESEVEEPKRQAYAQLAKARYALYGSSTYPDATFTLRLAFGQVKGYTEDGQKVPAFTTMSGLYQRSKEHQDKPPFDLPPRFVACKDKLDLTTPFNFVCTADIIGGNSGSPVINKNAEVVGLIFDGNIQSLVLDFIYDDVQARALSVDSRAILEALRKVYEANDIADELTGKKRIAPQN